MVKYIIYLLLAIFVEAVALAAYLPAFVEEMLRHSGPARPNQLSFESSVAAFILHLPTILLTYPFGSLVLVTPITQIVFWTWLFAYIGRKLGVK